MKVIKSSKIHEHLDYSIKLKFLLRMILLNFQKSLLRIMGDSTANLVNSAFKHKKLVYLQVFPVLSGNRSNPLRKNPWGDKIFW